MVTKYHSILTIKMCHLLKINYFENKIYKVIRASLEKTVIRTLIRLSLKSDKNWAISNVDRIRFKNLFHKKIALNTTRTTIINAAATTTTTKTNTSNNTVTNTLFRKRDYFEESKNKSISLNKVFFRILFYKIVGAMWVSIYKMDGRTISVFIELIMGQSEYIFVELVVTVLFGELM